MSQSRKDLIFKISFNNVGAHLNYSTIIGKCLGEEYQLETVLYDLDEHRAIFKTKVPHDFEILELICDIRQRLQKIPSLNVEFSLKRNTKRFDLDMDITSINSAA